MKSTIQILAVVALIVAMFSQPINASAADIFKVLFQFDFCTDTLLLSASSIVPAENVDFQVAGNLTSATVHAIVPVYDNVSESTFNVTVDLTWTSTSSLG